MSVSFLNTKAVDVVVKTSGTLPDGLTLDSIKTDPSSVMIIGEASALNDVTSITIPESVINLSDLTGSFITTVDISSYLPAGVTLADSSSAKVTITVLMAGETSSTMDVTAENIEFRNVPEGMSVALNSSDIKVNVFGSSEALDALKSKNIKGYVDCSGLAVGESQNAVLQFENIEGVTIQNTSVTVNVAENESKSSQAKDTEE